jgi:hypothetical protein
MIVAAAIRLDGKVYALPAPARHGNVIRRICERTGRKSVPFEPENQGFVDSELGFVNRQDAWVIAVKNGQLLDRAPTDGSGGTLYSEDVW